MGFCLFLFWAFFSVESVHAQTKFSLKADSGTVIMSERRSARSMDQSVQAVCADQSLEYALAKATGLSAINLNNVTSAQAAGQWFDTPAPITVSGADFYAFLPDGAMPLNVSVVLYASDANRLPLGAALATTTIAVTNEFGTGSLDELRQTVNFAAPVMIDGPYVLAVENPSPNPFSVLLNSYQNADGAGEDLGSVNITGTSWIPASSVNIGGVPLDADWLFEPLVTFELEAVITATPICVTKTTTVDFSVDSPFIESRFFDQAAFIGLANESYVWDFDDGSPTAIGPTQSHEYTFIEGVPFNPSVTATLNGWTGICEVIASKPLSLPDCDLVFFDRFE